MKESDKASLAAGLRASRVVELRQQRIAGPLDMLALRREVGERLQSSGGRPTDPSWKLSRQVPFKEESWSRLRAIAGEIGASGRRVGPAQVAALLVESSLEELDDARWREALEASRAMELLPTQEAAKAAKVAHSQFDDWVRRRWLVPAGRHGRQLAFSADEIVRAGWLAAIVRAGAKVHQVVDDVRACDLTARYLVFTVPDTVRTAVSRSQLYAILETPGGHLVIDQLPERRKLVGLPPIPGPDEHIQHAG